MELVKDFGLIEGGSTYKHTFTFDSNVLSVKPSCSCVRAKIDGNKVTVIFRPDGVPMHLKERGWYEPVKFVDVMLITGQKISVAVKGRVDGRS